MNESKKYTMKKTIKISEEANMLLKQLAKENSTTESKIFEWAIFMYAEKKPAHKNQEEQLDEIISRLSKIYEQNYHELNLLNSLAHHLDFQDFISAEENPYSWLTQSKKSFQNKMLNKSSRFSK